MLLRRKFFVLLPLFCFLIFYSCGEDYAVTIHSVSLNPDVQSRFLPGNTTLGPNYIIGEGSSDERDIAYPDEENPSLPIARAHNYYYGQPANIKLNFETIVTFSLYEYDTDLEDPGELLASQQTISLCTMADPVSGRLPVDVDGDEIELDITEEVRQVVSDNVKVFWKRCDSLPTLSRWRNKEGPFTDRCRRYEMNSSNDAIAHLTGETNDAYPFCLLDGWYPMGNANTYYHEVEVNNYNDSQRRFDTATFTEPISTTFIEVSENLTTYRVQMTPNEGNEEGQQLHHMWSIPIEEGIWRDNFSPDIRIEYVRFYYTDGNRLIPIKRYLGSLDPPARLQLGFLDGCEEMDPDGKFSNKVCEWLLEYTPACNKLDLSAPATWNLYIPFNTDDVEFRDHWRNPVVMEFGLRSFGTLN